MIEIGTKKKDKVYVIAFYLPQYHTIPENDEWWGPGFTEWTNVRKAQPRFSGHYQPHVPGELGYYDLRNSAVRVAQARLAWEHGIHGFCYYHYWFNGRRILERPFSEVLASGQPDFPFCLCWANENWTRVWDGGSKSVLLKQEYNHEDDLNHIKSLIPAFSDRRYIRIDGKPLFLVYRTDHLPAPSRTAEIWREYAWRSGAGELYLVRVESFGSSLDPRSIGFDAAIEFAPDWKILVEAVRHNILKRLLIKLGVGNSFFWGNYVFDYGLLAEKMLNKKAPGYKRFRCVCPSFDNSARRSKRAAVFLGSTPYKFSDWLQQTVDKTMLEKEGDERIVFVNAWNEWGEGNHLEPDEKWGRAYLESVAKVIIND